ncbi:unnamed protein product, partial [Ectocarpus sp. 6 AP-2014]
MPLIWRSKGLSEHQVGILGAIRPVASFFVTPVMCAFADRHSIHQQVRARLAPSRPVPSAASSTRPLGMPSEGT